LAGYKKKTESCKQCKRDDDQPVGPFHKRSPFLSGKTRPVDNQKCIDFSAENNHKNFRFAAAAAG